MQINNLFETLGNMFRTSLDKNHIMKDINITDIVPQIEIEEREDLFIMNCSSDIRSDYYEKINDDYTLEDYIEDENLDINPDEDIYHAVKIPDLNKEQLEVISDLLFCDFSDFCNITEAEYNYLKSIGK